MSDPRGPLTSDDIYLFNEGSHFDLHSKLGAHVIPGKGVRFAVWAPNASEVSVVGDFNGWRPDEHPMRPVGSSGIWEIHIAHAKQGSLYKFHIRSNQDRYEVEKADPFAFRAEEPPKTASVVWSLDHDWGDSEWMSSRHERNSLSAPISIYELHIGSWMRARESGQDERPLTYREIARRLVEYVKETGYTHVEFMPVMEHPFYGSWGYQITGYFAPSSRFGTPQDFMFLVDTLHRNGIGVILDWVPSHFPGDQHGLAFFDGTHLYEHQDPRKGFHPDWSSYIFNYGRNEVRCFLISNALFWLDKYHIDGLRVDAVASMLYLDYSRKEGEWIPNRYGGRENIEAIEFLKRFNEEVYRRFPDTQTIAEESTAWPMVSRPTYAGGLGFGMKWDMGWMHDTLKFLSHDPIHRKYHFGELGFRMIYAFNENFTLALSHDECVHGKGSLLARMPGDDWQKFANLRLLYSYMYAQPGKKLLFMGGEFGQRDEWNHDRSLDWHLLESPPHQGVRKLVTDLNRIYREEPAMHANDFTPAGFEWIDNSDWEHSTLAFLRKGGSPGEAILVIVNCTPVPRTGYRLGVPHAGEWREVLNSDAEIYGGGGIGNLGRVQSEPVPAHGHPNSVSLTLPPLAAVFLKYEREGI